MTIIEIRPLDNGAHRNQEFNGVVPDGWAIIPPDVQTSNFPFGDVVIADVDGVPTVTLWTANQMVLPEPEPEPEVPTEESSVWDELDAAYQEGVNTAYDQ